MDFRIHSDYKPTGDQPEAIEALANGVLSGEREQALVGVTGSGKTFTMANIIEKVQRPTLVLAHNKTLAAQLCSEFRTFFPENAVEYFISYYDYYQPEAYIPGKDLYIEKDALINDEIDRLRHSATGSLLERRDVIIVSSVSCIYSLGDPEEYRSLVVGIRRGMKMTREDFIRRLIAISYERNDVDLARDRFRVRGDFVELVPAGEKYGIRVEFFDDVIEKICKTDTVTGKVLCEFSYYPIYPASHYATGEEKRRTALAEIEREMHERVEYFRSVDKLLEAQRIYERTAYDIEMMAEIGYCSGVENYSRILSGRPAGSTPYTLLDYFPDDYLMFVDESHVTLPQVRGMSGGDRMRKQNLIDYGFRLPSAYDNRPLRFEEFQRKINQVIYVSATPGAYEKEHVKHFTEQLIRPTGLCDPTVEVRPTETQVDDLISEIRKCEKHGTRVLVTTLTKRMAEDLSEYLEQHGVKVRYMHHELETLERSEILRDLRLGVFDVLVGINLLREGLDLPEVELVAILDADKEGFLRTETSLIQTIGRAARNADGRVIMYADNMTDSMKNAIAETDRRRAVQTEYNRRHGIVPKTIIKEIKEPVELSEKERIKRGKDKKLTASERTELIEKLTKEMLSAADSLDFERAAYLRDRILELKKTAK